jgi:hypothetical protein
MAGEIACVRMLTHGGSGWKMGGPYILANPGYL